LACSEFKEFISLIHIQHLVPVLCKAVRMTLYNTWQPTEGLEPFLCPINHTLINGIIAPGMGSSVCLTTAEQCLHYGLLFTLAASMTHY